MKPVVQLISGVPKPGITDILRKGKKKRREETPDDQRTITHNS